MTKIKINWKPILVCLLAVVVFALTVVGLRSWNRSNKSTVGLALGNQAYEDKHWKDAAQYLGQYLSIHQQNTKILMKYAQAQLKIKPLKRDNLLQAINAYRRVLRNEVNPQAAQELALLYIQVNLPDEAELVANRFLEKQYDSEVQQILAVSLSEQNKCELAEREYMSLIEKDPHRVTAYDLLARLIEKQNAPDAAQKALNWYDRAVQNNPENPMSYISRSARYVRYDDCKSAIEDLQKAADCGIDDPHQTLSLAAAWVNVDQFDDAIVLLDSLETTLADEPKFWQLWATVAIQKGEAQMMLDVADKGLHHLADEPDSFLPMAVELYLSGNRVERAVQCIQNLRKLEGPAALVAYLEGLIAEYQGDFALSLEKWLKTIKLGRDDERLHLKVAGTYLKLDNRPAAIRQLKLFAAHHPDSYKTSLMLADLYQKEGRFDEVCQYAAEAMRLRPADTQAKTLYYQAMLKIHAGEDGLDPQRMMLETQIAKWAQADHSLPAKLMLLRLAFAEKDWAQADTIIKEISTRFPDRLEVYLAQADRLLMQNQFQGAIETLQDAIKKFPNAAQLPQMLAILLNQQNKTDVALELLSETLTKTTAKEDIRNLQFCEINILIKKGDTENANLLLKQMAQENPRDILVRRQLLSINRVNAQIATLNQWIDEIKTAEGQSGSRWRYETAYLLYERGDMNESYSQITELLNDNLANDPDDLPSRMLLARCHEKADHLRLAVEAYKESLDRYPDNPDVINATVSALYRAEMYSQADEILKRALARGLKDARLDQLELEGFMRQGDLSSADSVLQRIVQSAPESKESRLSLALLKIRQDKILQAESLIEQILVQDNEYVPALAAKIELLLKRKQPDQAMELCNKLVTERNTAQAYTLRARTYIQLQQNELAMCDIRILESRSAEDPAIPLVISELYEEMGHAQKAAQTVNSAIDQGTQNVLVLQRGAILLLRDDPKNQKGRELLDKALAMNPQNSQMRLLKAGLYLSDHNAMAVHEAINILEDLCSQSPKLESAWVQLSQWYYQQGNITKAMDGVLRGLSYSQNSKDLMLLKARIEAKSSETQAIPTLEHLLKLYPNDTDVVAALAQVYVNTSQSQKAIDLLNQKIDLTDPVKQKLTLQKNLMVALYENTQRDEAQTLYRQLIRTNPGDDSILLTWVRTLARRQQWSQIQDDFISWHRNNPEVTKVAIGLVRELAAMNKGRATRLCYERLKQWLEESPNSEDVNYAFARLTHMIGDLDQAITYYQKTLEINPFRLIAVNNLAWILSQNKNQHAQALELVERGLQIDPYYIDMCDTRGMIYFSMGQYSRALEDFKRCVQMYLETQPSRTASCFHLAKTYAQLGQNTQALDYLLQAKQMCNQNGGLSISDKDELYNMFSEFSETAN